ncbi:MAG: methylenetetrahydrofolate reductase [Candidatus Wallbacteria bacterium]|nr:methylenetetrahydrofolate reductase [Candidatus Wallbacteria bacterium]
MEKYQTQLEKKLNNREFPVTIELFSVRGTGIKRLLSTAERLKGTATAFNITDNHRATMRACPMSICARIAGMGIEPVLQVTCRDRNRLALQSDLLGANILGIRNVLVITGDHLKFGDNPTAYPVFDLDSVQLLQFMSGMEKGRDSSGQKLHGTPSFFKGAAINLCASPEWIHLAKAKKKICAGADFFQTQLIFDPELALKMKNKISGAFMLAGVTILKNYAFAQYLKDKIPGIVMPDEVLRKMLKAGDEIRAGIEIAAETVRDLKDHVDGIHFMALGMEEYIPEVLKKAGIS